jgi:hypothetical protein
LKPDIQDHAGQTKAADGRPEQRLVLIRTAGKNGAVRPGQPERQDMLPEGAGAVMILAMDIVGDGAADRDELGARRNGQEPDGARLAAPRYHPQDRGELDAGLAGQHAGIAVELKEPVQPPHVDQRSAVVQAGVAVRPAHSESQHRVRPGSAEQGRHRLTMGGPRHVVAEAVIAAPGQIATRDGHDITTPS